MNPSLRDIILGFVLGAFAVNFFRWLFNPFRGTEFATADAFNTTVSGIALGLVYILLHI